jgi:hypothetical protein
MDGHNSDDDIYPAVVDESDEEDESSFKRARTFGTHACVYISASVLPVEQSPANNHSNDVDPLLLLFRIFITMPPLRHRQSENMAKLSVRANSQQWPPPNYSG